MVRNGITRWSAGVLALVALPLCAQVPPRQSVRLTPIAGGDGSECVISLDLRQTAAVAFTAGSGWRVGVNGRAYDFSLSNSSYDSTTGTFTLRSANRAVVVRIRPLRQITTREQEGDVVSIAVTMNGAGTTAQGYRFCAPGD